MKPVFDLSLYLVTDRRLCAGKRLTDIVEQAVKGGVTMVQLREKDCPAGEFYGIAVELMEILKPGNVPLIINDRLDIALACNAHGLHIGQSDIPYNVARGILGYDKIIGLSVENEADAIEANKLDVDYIGISPVFTTPTKIDTATALGIAGTGKISRLSIHPCVGIGGINNANAADIIAAGADGIAVVSAIISAENPESAAKELKLTVTKNKNK